MPFLSWDPRIESEEFFVYGAYNDVKFTLNKDIPLLDIDAWDLFPKYNYVYNKLQINRASGIPCNMMGASRGPDDFPVVVRPIYNLYGMGCEARQVDWPNEFEKLCLPGFFCAKKIVGPHCSWDMAVVRGDVVWCQTFSGMPHDSELPGMFSHWSTSGANPTIKRKVESWVDNNLAGFTGMVNVETIGGYIIECHLRVGDSLYLGNGELLQSIVDLYEFGDWSFTGEIGTFHLFPVWVRRPRKGCWPSDPAVRLAIQDLVEENFSTQIIEVDDDWPGDPLYARRVMLLGNSDLRRGQDARDEIEKLFDSPVMHIGV